MLIKLVNCRVCALLLSTHVFARVCADLTLLCTAVKQISFISRRGDLLVSLLGSLATICFCLGVICRLLCVSRVCVYSGSVCILLNCVIERSRVHLYSHC